MLRPNQRAGACLVILCRSTPSIFGSLAELHSSITTPMATALSSVRAGASRVSSSILGLTATTSSPAAAAAAGSLKPSHGLRGKKLINEMHRRLYPQLYKDDGKPKSPLKGSHHTRLRHKAAEKSREAMKKGWYRQKLRMNSTSVSFSGR